jgi:hypothetical protein
VVGGVVVPGGVVVIGGVVVVVVVSADVIVCEFCGGVCDVPLLTVTMLFAETRSATAVIVATPGCTPVTTPLPIATLAIVVSLEYQLTEASLAPDSNCPDPLLTIAIKLTVEPTVTVAESNVTVIDAGGGNIAAAAVMLDGPESLPEQAASANKRVDAIILCEVNTVDPQIRRSVARLA